MITIVDAPCGYGKTSWAINFMNEEKFDRFIYITPFLDELKRVVKSCDEREFIQPNEKLGKGSKRNHFYDLVETGVNVCSTHALFRGVSPKVIDTIKEMEYILILDEVADVVENLDISKRDIQILINEKIISIADDNKVEWIDEEYIGKFSFLKNPIKNGDVYLYNNTMILWTFPCDIFKAFKHVYVMTYLFKGQIQRYYYDLNKLEYEYKSVEFIKTNGVGSKARKIYELTNYKEINGVQYKELINIYDGKLNDIGKDKYSLSKTWYDKASKKELMKNMKNNTYNYFKNILKSKSKLNIWTTFEDYKNQCKGEGYTNGFVACNARATNEYKNRTNCAYLCNRYYNPMIKQFFIDKGVSIDEDTWALSELIQWLFRSAVRENNSINLYIPSERMRRLLSEWLEK
ncbi:hypothetical protein [Peptostreptococcus porci]|uniref:hypothetical protein n=1 Tax=Peptostreptococcus porci TaxID=2652282 RepID=UPI002A7F3CAF|nr:hypothetical protein [Peptostreptococcus porci]MDY4127629.1 hypothetical protein [Peptostreptococcus porci]